MTSRSRPSSRVRSRSEADRGRGRRRAPTSTSNQPLIFGGLALGAVVLAIVFAMSHGGDTAGASTRGAADGQTRADTAAGPAATGPAATGPAASAPVAAGTARAGGAPGRPAPKIDPAVIDAADALYRKAAGVWNEAQDARNAGETALYQDKCLACWEVFDELFASIGDYTAWFEEADMEDWAMPAEYDVLQSHLDKWDKLRVKVKKVKPAKR